MSALSRALPASARRPGWLQTLESYLLDPDRPAQSDVQAAVYAAIQNRSLDKATIALYKMRVAQLEDELVAVEVRAHHNEHRIS